MEPEKETTLTFSLEDTVALVATIKNSTFLLRSQIKDFKCEIKKIKFGCSPYDTLNLQRIEKSEKHVERLDSLLEIKEKFYEMIKDKICAQGIDIEKEMEKYVKEK